MAPLSAFCIVLDKVIIVAGPTASGKSAHAYKLAQELNGVILNGDSLQIYRGLEILTAQPSCEDRQTLSHRLYGVLDPQNSCSAGQWLSLILPEIDKAHQEGTVPLVVGGTGFYLKALLEGIPSIPPIDPVIRTRLQERQDDLHAKLKIHDPVLAERINPHDTQRILRGLEVFYGTGKPLSFWQSQKPTPFPYTFEKVLLMPSKEDLSLRIEQRLEMMLVQGVVEEVARVMAQPLSPTASKAIGLKEFQGYIEGKSSLKDAKELVLLRTCQYAKRQRTWFRHQF